MLEAQLYRVLRKTQGMCAISPFFKGDTMDILDEVKKLSIADESPLFKEADFHIPPNAKKVPGHGMDAIILWSPESYPTDSQIDAADPLDAGVKSHVSGPYDPGFQYSYPVSEVRPGEKYKLRVSFSEIYMGGIGSEVRFNPLAEFIPSTLANPVLMFLRVAPMENFRELILGIGEALG